MQVVRKADGFAAEVSLEKLVLDRPSIIHLRIAPEDVAKFERRGNDLALVLKDGSTVVVQGFFTEYPDGGRNDLVLEDDAGVLWWGQHGSPWSEFHFTEVEWLDGVPVAAAAGALPEWLIAGLALLGVGAAAAAGSSAGGGGGIGFVPPTVNPPAPPPNQAPTGEVKGVTVRDGGVSQGQVVGRDADGDALQFVVSGAPAHGVVTIDPATGAFTYTPQPGYTGADSFDVTLTDGRGGSVTVRVPVTVEPAPTQENQSPTASAPALSVDEDAPVRGRVDAQDPDGDAVRYEVSQPPAHGTVTLDPETGEYVYTPAPNYNGDDSFDVTVSDGKGGTVTVTVPVTVVPVNDSPVGTALPVSTEEDKAVSGQVNGTDVDGDTLGYVLGKPPAHGSVSIDPLTGQYTYTPASNYHGADSFEVIVSDGKGGSVTVSVPVTITPVNDAPVASAPALDTDVNVPVAGQVTASDPDGDVLSYAVAMPPAHGTVALDPETGAYTYTPADGYSGSDSFQLVVSDGKGGTVTVTVPVTIDAAPQPGNQNPSATAPALTTPEDSPIDGKVTGTDPDGDALTYAVGQPPVHGVVTLNPTTGTYTYTPAANYHGNDSFSVVVSDGRGGSVTVSVPVTVTPVNDAPVAPNQNLTVAEDTPLSGQVGGSDVDGDALSYALNTGPVNGSVTLNPNSGQFTYTPNANFHGTDSFIVTVSDGRGGTVNSTITIGVTPVNDAPTTANQALTTPEDVALGGQIQALDTDGDSLSYTLSTAPQHGSLSLNPATGQFVYTPAANYNGSDSFVVTVSDGKGGVVTSTVTVGVTPANDAPVTADQSLSVDANTPLGGQVVASDVDGDVLGYGVLTAPMNGTLVLNPATGQFTYTPNNGYVGTDSFEVRVSDGQGGMTVSTITVGVGLDNESPVANADTISVAEGGTATVLVGGATSLLANDTDAENAPLTAILVSGPANGTLTL
ncbi:MAG: tandem-95 repeat protein, partial [Comamonadaceae bacterium]